MSKNHAKTALPKCYNDDTYVRPLIHWRKSGPYREAEARRTKYEKCKTNGYQVILTPRTLQSNTLVPRRTPSKKLEIAKQRASQACRRPPSTQAGLRPNSAGNDCPLQCRSDDQINGRL